MSLHPPMAAPTLAVAAEFQNRFVRDAHILVAEGYSRLAPETLAKKSEEAISGAIVQHAEDWLDEPSTPSWTQCYFIKPEIAERLSPQEGRHRPRIDIYVESSAARPRPRFAFEAKRMYRSDSIAAYVGPEGLGAFVDGTYVPDAPAAAMLGFVQDPQFAACVSQLRDKVDENRAGYGVARWGSVWASSTLDARLGPTWITHHTRLVGTPVAIYHSFLRCHGATAGVRHRASRNTP